MNPSLSDTNCIISSDDKITSDATTHDQDNNTIVGQMTSQPDQGQVSDNIGLVAAVISVVIILLGVVIVLVVIVLLVKKRYYYL